eukprot:SAG31_NODE_647_length_13211_cov_10.529362_3_plen_49_part_00
MYPRTKLQAEATAVKRGRKERPLGRPGTGVASRWHGRGVARLLKHAEG